MVISEVIFRLKAATTQCDGDSSSDKMSSRATAATKLESEDNICYYLSVADIKKIFKKIVHHSKFYLISIQVDVDPCNQ